MGTDELTTVRFLDGGIVQMDRSDYDRLRAQVPEGWVVVPKAATGWMLENGHAFFPREWNTGEETSMKDVAEVYAAMLAAAPHPQQPVSDADAPTPQKGVDDAPAEVDGWEALADQDDADLEAYLGDRT